MKRKMKIGVVSDFAPVPEEYQLFRNQPEKVLACYSLAGVLIGLYAAAPMLSHARALKEALRGI